MNGPWQSDEMLMEATVCHEAIYYSDNVVVGFRVTRGPGLHVFGWDHPRNSS